MAIKKNLIYQKKKEEDNHSRSIIINNIKGCVDEINSSLTKLNNNRTFFR